MLPSLAACILIAAQLFHCPRPGTSILVLFGFLLELHRTSDSSGRQTWCWSNCDEIVLMNYDAQVPWVGTVCIWWVLGQLVGCSPSAHRWDLRLKQLSTLLLTFGAASLSLLRMASLFAMSPPGAPGIKCFGWNASFKPLTDGLFSLFTALWLATRCEYNSIESVSPVKISDCLLHNHCNVPLWHWCSLLAAWQNVIATNVRREAEFKY